MGLDQLKQLGCGFIAFYGAEPLFDFEGLPEAVGAAEELGIHTTVITSGVVNNFFGKLDALYEHGAKSLSMSYDIIPTDSSTVRKMSMALEGLLYFQKKGSIRDVAAICTLTAKNAKHLPETIKYMTDRGIWTFFDIIHPDRGQFGSKCKNYDGIDELLFNSPEKERLLLNTLEQVRSLKESGHLCHTSTQFIDFLLAYPNTISKYGWNCGKEVNFPAWVTVDVDGRVLPCDDFNSLFAGTIYVWEIAEKWDEFSDLWKSIVKNECYGCIWNTHYDAHMIKYGLLPFSDYVHTKETL
jgi:MoaA/NifB/PqqE/SkfB family radical SAM enzyme